MRTDIVGWVRLEWDRASAWLCALAGAISLVVGWVGVSSTAFTAKQLPYIAGCGLGGMFLLGTAALLWLSADLRDEWRKLDRIELAIREHGLVAIDDAADDRVRGGTVSVSPEGSGREVHSPHRSGAHAGVAAAGPTS